MRRLFSGSIKGNFGIDADVMEWFRTKGKGYQTIMNAVLKRMG
ncbi:BrnA antitoxin family protein [Patescibacteria group bacterium]|nr:BrnA antitoxin family protein [Patescibacteria group bacterium]